MAMTAVDVVELEESEVLFGMDDVDDRGEEEDEEDEEEEELRRKMMMAKKQHLPRVESCGKDEFSTRRMNQQRRWTQQSRSMPATSSGYLLAEAHRWRRNNQLNEDVMEDDQLDDYMPLEANSDPIQIPTKHTHIIAIPVQQSAPLHWRRKSTEESDDNQFVPPHQMIERDCFSLGMKHYFKHKPGNI